MDILFVTTEQAYHTLALVFGGVVFGAIGSALVMTYIWNTRKQQLEERGERYRERIKGRFTRLHKRSPNHNA